MNSRYDEHDDELHVNANGEVETSYLFKVSELNLHVPCLATVLFFCLKVLCMPFQVQNVKIQVTNLQKKNIHGHRLNKCVQRLANKKQL